MGKVTALPKAANDAPTQAEEIVPAFEIAVAANFAELQQVHIRLPVKDPITRSEANRLVDLATDLAQRQVSRMEIRLNTAALADKRKALALQQGRETEQEAIHEAAIAEVQAKIVELETHHAEVDQAGAVEWSGLRRQGDYKAQGKRKSQLDGIGRDIEAQRDRVKTLEAEYQQKVKKAQADIIERLTEEIAAIERVIAKHQEVVG